MFPSNLKKRKGGGYDRKRRNHILLMWVLCAEEQLRSRSSGVTAVMLQDIDQSNNRPYGGRGSA